MAQEKDDIDFDLVQSYIDRNYQLTLQVIDRDETIKKLQEQLQMLGAKFTDMKWQRDALHMIVLNENRTIRFRQISQENQESD